MGIVDKIKTFVTSPVTRKAIRDVATGVRVAAVDAGRQAAVAAAEWQKLREEAAKTTTVTVTGGKDRQCAKAQHAKRQLVAEYHANSGERHERGTIVVDVTSTRIIQMLRDQRIALQLQIGNISIPEVDEQQHFLLAGAPGTGKSVTIKSMLATIRSREEKAVIFDPAGDMVAAFYRPEIDYILNPLDARDSGWNPWADLERYEYPAFAKAIVPDVQGSTDPFWTVSAQAVLQALLATCTDMNQLLYHGLVADDSDLMALVRKAGKAGLVGQEKTFSGVRANLSGELDKLSVLRNVPASDALSIKKWVENTADKGWIFMSAKESQLETLKPLIRVWIDIMARAAMSLEPDRNRRIWCVIDELPSLGKITALAPAMTKGRKYGLTSIIGIQNASQMREAYGKDGAASLLALPKTQLILRVADAETQDEMSKLLGEKQIRRTTWSHTPGQLFVPGSQSSSTQSEQVSTERAVLPAEIGALPDLQGFLRVGGENVVARVHIPVDDIPPDREPGFISIPQRRLPWELTENYHD